MSSSITIKTNIASLLTQRRLGQSTYALQQSFTRLSSGLRINKASDDAAGLAISESLNADAHVFNQGVRNLNDGISALNVADGAIQQLSNIVVRLQELAEQAANGTLGHKQREALDEEAQELSREYTRIARSTEFNGRSLFHGDFGELRLQAGYGTEGGIASGLGGAIGDGTFTESGTYTAEGFLSKDVSLGDLNGDGILDMVTAGVSGAFTGEATVFLGQGDGTFARLTSYDTEGSASYSVALGDVNGDGILDMLTTGFGGGEEATVFLGQGDGTFSELTAFTIEGSNAMALGDLNGDGMLDVITAGAGGGGGIATVFLGQGDGTFSKLTTHGTESTGSNAVTLGDLNGDGVLDMVTAGYTGSNGEATVFLGQGDGTFSKVNGYTTENNRSRGVALGDLNGDGVLDMVTTGLTDGISGETTVFLGQGDGTFAKLTTYAGATIDSDAVVLGDVDGDDVLDMVIAGVGVASGTTRVFFGLGDGRFSESATYSTEAGTSHAVALGDLNGDGVLDVVTAGSDSVGGATALVGDTTQGVSPLLEFSLATQADALQALPVFQRKLDQLAAQRGQIGAFQARIGVAVNTLQVAKENYLAARSQIVDADMAKETAELVKNRILQQTGAAILAQANQAPELALLLLG